LKERQLFFEDWSMKILDSLQPYGGGLLPPGLNLA